MPKKCEVCTKNLYSYQNFIQCTSCFGWIHHGNRLECSSLTDTEFEEHVNDIDKAFTCDNCISANISKMNNSVFQILPFPVECEDNIFGKPPEVKRKPDISSMTTSELKKFVSQCKNIENRIKSVSDDENEEDFFNSMVDSKYYNIKVFNRMKPDKSSSLGLMHVNIASLDANVDDLRSV